MGLRSLRNLSLLAAAAVAVSGCAQGPLAGGSGEPRAEVAQASGDFAVANSRNGQAIFRADGIAPGRSVSGTVELRNSGRLAGELSVSQVDIRDTPGVNGGLLSQAVELAVQDVSRPEDPITRFAGRLGELDGRVLGTLAAGQTKAYRFTATLPDRGIPASLTTGDNAYIGSGMTVTYTWTATAPDETGPSGGQSGAPRVSYRIVTKKLFKRRRLDVVARCDRPCRLTAWAKLPKPTKRAKRAPVTKRKSVNAAARKRVRIKLKLTKRQQRLLIAQRQRSRKLGLRVYVKATATSGESKTFTRRHALRVKKQRR